MAVDAAERVVDLRPGLDRERAVQFLDRRLEAIGPEEHEAEVVAGERVPFVECQRAAQALDGAIDVDFRLREAKGEPALGVIGRRGGQSARVGDRVA